MRGTHVGADGQRCRYLVVGAIAFALVALSAVPANAQTTHKFLEYWNTPAGSEPEPQTVDRDGNVYVYNSGTNSVSRYGPYGEPAPFSGLGTNTIDGVGGPNCPTVEADCDRVPAGELRNEQYRDMHVVGVDNSNGPAAGDIYVLNKAGGPPNIFEEPGGVVEVFGPNGRFMGEIDESKDFPRSAVSGYNYNTHSDLIVDRNGHIYVGGADQIDQYVPIDANPEHDEFIGQLRTPMESFSAGPTYTVVSSSNWLQYKPAAYSVQVDPQPVFRSSVGCPTGFTGTEFIPPCGELWGDGGIDPDGNDVFRIADIDPRNEDVYLVRPATIEQWDKDSTHQIGPQFGAGINAGNGLAFDVTGGATDGRIYARGGHNGSNSVAVFSPPVHVPDINYEPAIAEHFGFTVEADVDLDGGPEVTNCRIEYGLTRAVSQGTVPCDQATPYPTNEHVTATVAGLPTEKLFYYRVRVVTSNGTIFGERKEVRTAAVLSLQTQPATEITPTTASLNGEFDPDGMPTTYFFEYGVTADYEQESAEAISPAGHGSYTIPPVEVTNLQPGRLYHFALVGSNALGTTQGPDQTFVASGRPIISGVRATDVLETSAVLRARINPLGEETKYRFEYGESLEYGSIVPANEGVIEPSNSPQEVVVPISDLRSGVTYHFRIVATNKWDTSYGEDTTISFLPELCPNSYVRQLTSATRLPDCRAYELVSPPEANGVQLFPGSMTADPRFGRPFDLSSPTSPYRPRSSNRGFAESPSRFGFWGALGVMPEADAPNTSADMYVATRSNTGWTTVYPGVPGKESSGNVRITCSDSMSRCLSYRYPGFYHFGLAENTPWVWSTKKNSDFLEKWPTNYKSIPNSTKFKGEGVPSGDFSHFIFSSLDPVFAPGGTTAAPGSTYDNDIAAKTVTVISRQPNGAAIGQEVPRTGEFIRIRAVSSDGSHVLMTTNSEQGPENAYLRVNDSVTYQIGIGIRVFGLTRNGSEILFSSNNRLSPEDTDNSGDIYMWRESTQTVKLLSGGGTGAGNSDDCSATWTGRCGALIPSTQREDTDSKFAIDSGDVVFYSPELLDPTTPGIPEQRNVYETHNGAIQLIATLDPGTTIDRLQISPDGRYVGLVTRSALTGYDNVSCDYEVEPENGGAFERSTDCAPMEEMYRYDADRQTLVCVSCMRDGSPPTNDVLASAGGLFMADDGRMFFSSSDPLVPEDTDGIYDVYEYTEGKPQLISAGNGVNDLYTGGLFYPPQRTGLEGVSHTGVDVYFSTFDTLVPQDHNGDFVKFYDARTGGGFPREAGLLPCKAADECHGPASEPAPTPQVGTNTDLGAGGNRTESHDSRTGRKRHEKQRRRRHHQHRKHRAGAAGNSMRGLNRG